MPVTFTTDLPAVSGLMLDSTIEDEITATWTDTQNYGSYHVQHKESSSSTWTDDGTVPETDTDVVLGALEDGEEYDVRLRGETEHRTTAWLTATSITLLPPPTGFTAEDPPMVPPDVASTLNWTDNSDNPDEQYEIHASTDGGSTFSLEETLAANSETTEFSGAANTQYTLKVRVTTAHAQADSSTVTIRTPLAGASGPWIAFRRSPGDYFQLDSGLTQLNPIREPGALSDWRATIAYDESFESEVFDEIWLYDGTDFLFRGELVGVESAEGRATTTLRGYDVLYVLTNSDTTVTYQNILAWKAIEDFITTETPFTADVTEPSATSTSESYYDITSVSGLESAANAAADVPVRFNTNSDAMEQAESGFVAEAENGTYVTPFAEVSDSAYSNGEGVDSGDFPGQTAYLEVDITTEYDIPVSDLTVQMAAEYPNGTDTENDSPEFTISIDGTNIHHESEDTRAKGDPDWDSVTNNIDNLGSTLSAGTHTIRFDFASTASDGTNRIIIDAFALADIRFQKTSVGGGYMTSRSEDVKWTLESGYSKYPEKYGNDIRVPFQQRSGSYNLTGADVTTKWNDPADAVFGVTFDDFGTESTHAGSETASFSNPSDPTTSLTFYAELNRFDSGTNLSAPTAADGTTYLFDTNVDGTGNTRGVIDAETFEGSAFQILQTLHQRAEMTFTAGYAEAADATSTIASFKPGDVTGSASWVTVDRKRTFDTEDYYNEVVVRGGEKSDGTRETVQLPDDDEIAAFGETRTLSIKKPGLTSRKALKSVARTALDRAVDQDSLTGRLTTNPVMVDPGKAYLIDEWGETLVLQRVIYSLGADGLNGTLVFEALEGLGDQLSGVSQREQETRDSL